MLFFTRCFLCIGAVVVLVEGVDLSGLVNPTGDTAGSLARQARAQVEAFCRTKPASCLAAAEAALQAGQDLKVDPTAPPASGPVKASKTGGRHAAEPPPDLSLRRADLK